MGRIVWLLVALLAAPAAAQNEFVLALEYESSSERLGDMAGTSSSSGRQQLGERIIARGPQGTEAEYFLTSKKGEARGNDAWIFPVRILIAADGSKSVLNKAELEARVDVMLAKANWTRDACSRWYFTWNAFQVRCDPAAALEAIDAYGMSHGAINEGATIAINGVAQPVALSKSGERGDRILLRGSAKVDAQSIRESEAQTAMIVAEISGKAISLEAAKAQSATVDATGTVAIELEVDAAGLIWRRTNLTEVTVKGGKYGDEVRRSVQTIRRIPLADWEREQATHER